MIAEVRKLKIILTGGTGMVGEVVLFECLKHPAIDRVLTVNRRSYPMRHPKLEELIVPDFLDLDKVTSQLSGYDACFFCSGISSSGMSEATYTHITYDVTVDFAQTLSGLNPQMTFVYVSGSLTDSSEKGRIMWARAKGRTENTLMRLVFRQVYNFRPGFMKPTPGQKNIKSYYKVIGWLYPFLRVIFPNHVSTMSQVGTAMIKSVLLGYPRQVLEIKGINALAEA